VARRVAVFAIASAMAAVGGLMQAPPVRGQPELRWRRPPLNAIAAAVIGGTSLFGGRGGWSSHRYARDRLDPGGILLLSLKSDAQYMITGAVLLVAVTIVRSRAAAAEASGRA
jgi:ABC-type xylose transport system permease subunit